MNIISSIVNNMTIRERKDGRLEGRISIQGKRKGFYGKTKTEVKNQAKEHLQKVENGYKEPKSIWAWDESFNIKAANVAKEMYAEKNPDADSEYTQNQLRR